MIARVPESSTDDDDDDDDGHDHDDNRGKKPKATHRLEKILAKYEELAPDENPWNLLTVEIANFENYGVHQTLRTPTYQQQDAPRRYAHSGFGIAQKNEKNDLDDEAPYVTYTDISETTGARTTSRRHHRRRKSDEPATDTHQRNIKNVNISLEVSSILKTSKKHDFWDIDFWQKI